MFGWMDGWMNTAEPFGSGGSLRHLAILSYPLSLEYLNVKTIFTPY